MRTKAWIEAMRLRTLPVSTAGVIAGTACALMADGFRWLPALICLVFAILAQTASNFANEYYDFRNGLDRKGREGFRRGVTEGDITPTAMKRATFALLAVDAAVGCCLIPFGGWWLVGIGAAIAVFALAYSTGPYPLSHHGLGDVAVIIFFGIVPVCLTAYVQTGDWQMLPYTLPVSVAVGLLAANVLIVNNYRDHDDDAAVGKRTTAVIFGRKTMAGVYLTFALTATVIATVATYGRIHLIFWILLILETCLPIRIWQRLRRTEGSALNPLLGKTALCLLLFSLTLLAGALSF